MAHDNEYLEDVPEIDEDTTPEDLIEYTQGRIQSPIEINGKTIYNFNSHEPDMDALNQATQKKLVRDTYMIPFQVSGAWTAMTYFLPEPVRESEILVYRNSIGEYYAYQNYLRDIPEEEISRIRQNFATTVFND